MRFTDCIAALTPDDIEHNMIKLQYVNYIKKVRDLVITWAFVVTIYAPCVQAEQDSADERFVYAGLELGISEPTWKEFNHLDGDTSTNIRISRSRMIGGRIGYGFYPNMVAEISATHQPQYNLNYILPEVELPRVGLTIPKTPGRTKIKTDTYTLNLIYTLDSLKVLMMKPYVIGGAGIARANIAQCFSTWHSPMGDIDYFKVPKQGMYVPAYQVGLGVSAEIGERVEVDFSAKFQVLQGLKIKYEKMNLSTRDFKPARPIKQSVAVSEIALGMIFKVPI